MINITPQPSNQISFQSIKPTIRIGEQAIKEFSEEFGSVKSSTMTMIKILHAKGLPNAGALVPKIQRRAWEQYSDLCHIRTNLYVNSFDGYIKTLIPLIKKYQVANCGEMAFITQHKLLNRGIKMNVIRLLIKNKKDRTNIKRLVYDHAFLAANIAKGAPHDKPERWGSKAVIFDPWLRKSAAAHEMMEYYERFFKIDEANEHMIFENCDKFDVDRYLKNRY